MTQQKVQVVVEDQFRKNDKFTKKSKGTDNTAEQTLHQEVEQDEAEDASDGDDNGCDDEASTDSEGFSEGVGEKHTRGLQEYLEASPCPACSHTTSKLLSPSSC